MSEEKPKPLLQLDEHDSKKLMALYLSAQNAPVIKMSSDLKEKDLSTLAWEEVQKFQIELGSKYNYDWEKVAVNGKGEVFKIE